jgi:hypothetical protein
VLPLAPQEPNVSNQQTVEHSATPPGLGPKAEKSAAELSDHGIVAVQVTTYEWGGYRYSNAADALAAAKRAAR